MACVPKILAKERHPKEFSEHSEIVCQMVVSRKKEDESSCPNDCCKTTKECCLLAKS